jgi:uncharacterized protein (DUF2147 family)
MVAERNCQGRRTLKLFRKLGIAGLFSIVLSGLALAEEGANGVWMLDSGKVTVRITPCGDSLCGAIVGLAKPLNKRGQPKVDKKNPNEALRNRPLIGLTILANMKPAGENRWKGTIYNADDGRTYSSYMNLSGSNMKVKGCVGPLCKTMVFVRQN